MDRGPQLVLGTAGHIDHGKTALVRALTGVDTDRLPEEKERGITIRLGFAPLDLGGGLRLGVVDVPGHERLVRTMVSGASGIDLVLLVVAADDGVMPQTREHVAICELLGIERGVVALTKVDLVDDEMLELVTEDVREALADTSLAGLPLVRTSSQTGLGIEALREALSEAAHKTQARTARHGPPRLPVDRVFALRGFGTVVTGTLVGGPLSVGDPVALYPSGRRARLRGLQRHGEPARRIEPGTRCAANLQGLNVGEIERGEVLSLPDALACTLGFDARLQWLGGAPPLRGRVSAELLTGTAKRRARVTLLGTPALAPGSSGFARLHVEGAPLALVPGDRFIVRGFARTELSGATLGGGEVLDVAPPRRRRADPAVLRELGLLAQREPETDVWVRVERAGVTGVARGRLRRETGLPEPELQAVVRVLVEQKRVALGRGGSCIAEPAIEKVACRIHETLAAFHAREPLREGMALGALRGALPAHVPPDVFDLVLEREEKAGRLVTGSDAVRLAGHRAELGDADRDLAERVVRELRQAQLEPPSLKEWVARLGRSPQRVRALLVHLERTGDLVRAPGELWFDAQAVATLRRRIVERLREVGSIATPDYKALIGTTRRHAVPLMELFDSERLTLRVGNRRVLRGSDG